MGVVCGGVLRAGVVWWCVCVGGGMEGITYLYCSSFSSLRLSLPLQEDWGKQVAVTIPTAQGCR